MTYPRDMVGYGARPPQANWPNGAKLALQFIVAFEEGSENCILHGDAHSENFISDIIGAQRLVLSPAALDYLTSIARAPERATA